jgi:hypothetical protein
VSVWPMGDVCIFLCMLAPPGSVRSTLFHRCYNCGTETLLVDRGLTIQKRWWLHDRTRNLVWLRLFSHSQRIPSSGMHFADMEISIATSPILWNKMESSSCTNFCKRRTMDCEETSNSYLLLSISCGQDFQELVDESSIHLAHFRSGNINPRRITGRSSSVIYSAVGRCNTIARRACFQHLSV